VRTAMAALSSEWSRLGESGSNSEQMNYAGGWRGALCWWVV